MSHDFVKPKKIGGLDTNSHTGQRSPFASRPFLATPRSQSQPQDIQTMRERAARYQAANPHLYGTSAQPQTVQRQASETEEESLQMKANESVQTKPEQPDLQTLIRQRAARADTPLQRMMKVQMAEAQGLEQEKDDLQMRQESSVQREAMPEEQEEKKPEDIQAKADSQPEDLEKEEDLTSVQAKAESEPEDLEKKPEDIQPKLNSTVQAQEDLENKKPEDLQAKADSQPEDLEEDSPPVQTKAEPTETLEEETKLQEKQELNVQSQPSQQEEKVELQQKVNQAIQQQKLDEQKKDAQLQTRIDRSIQRQKVNKDRDQGHLQQQINRAVQHQELEKQQEETRLQGRINRAIQKQKAREDEDILKAPPAKTQSVRPKSFQTKLQNKLQTKLTVGKPGDKYEQEADKVAAKVMAMPETEQKISQETELAPQEEPEVQMRSLADSITSVGQGQLTGEPQSVVQNKEGQSSNKPDMESRLASQQGQGSPIPDETRSFMESRFGADFGNVRIHTGSQAVQMNKELGAQAFTHGNDVYFNSGKFNPGSSSGKELFAHELAHTIQQTGGVQAKLLNTPEEGERKKTQKVGNADVLDYSNKEQFKAGDRQLSSALENQSPYSSKLASQPESKSVAQEAKQLESEETTKLKNNKDKEALKQKQNSQSPEAKQSESESAVLEQLQTASGQTSEGKNQDVSGATDVAKTPNDNVSSSGATTGSPNAKTENLSRQKPGGGADSSPVPQDAVSLSGEDPGQIIEQLKTTPPTQASATFAQAGPASAQALENQRQQMQETLPEIPAPTGLPAQQGDAGAVTPQAAAKIEPTQDAQVSEPSTDTSEQVSTEQVVEVQEAPPAPNQPPTQLAGGEKTEDGQNDEALTRSAQNSLANVRLDNSQVSTSAGERPNVKLTGEADPSKMQRNLAQSGQKVQSAKAKAAQKIHQDFGENNIFPQSSNETLKANKELSAVKAPEANGGKPVALPGVAVAGLNQSLSPYLQEKIGAEQEKYKGGKEKFDVDSAKAKADANQEVERLDEETKQKQLKEQQNAKSEVAQAREEWQTELDSAEQDYQDKAAKATTEQRQKIDTEQAKGESEAAQHLDEAEKKAEAEKQKADRDATKEKADAEKKSGGFWGWAKSAAKSLIDGLKQAVNFIYDNLRKAVKAIFEAAKKLAMAAIELARKAIVGLIKAFGEILKGLVNVVFAAFPGIAKKITAKIDQAVNKAEQAVNAAADLLKKGISAILDFLANTLDQLLGLIQDLYNGIFTVIGMIINGELKELLAKIGNLIRAAKAAPPQFETAGLEELLGGNLDESLSPQELSQAAAMGINIPSQEGGSTAQAGENYLPSPPWTQENVGVDAVENNMELLQEPAAELMQRTNGDGEVMLGESNDKSRSIESMISEATGQQQQESGKEQAKNPDDGLSPRQRADIKWQMMNQKISKWWSENWPLAIGGTIAAAGAIAGALIVSGGSVAALIPPIMSVLTPLFAGITIATIGGHIRDYVAKGWGGDSQGGGKSLAKGLAAGAIELVSWLTLKAGGAALKGAKAAAKGVKAVAKGGIKLAKKATQAVIKGAKYVIQKGKVLFKGIAGSGIGKQFKRLQDLGKGLLERMRFKAFRIRVKNRRFVLEGLINPWVELANGDLKKVSFKGKGRKKVGDSVTLDDGSVGKVVGIRNKPSKAVQKLIEAKYGLPPGGAKLLSQGNALEAFIKIAKKAGSGTTFDTIIHMVKNHWNIPGINRWLKLTSRKLNNLEQVKDMLVSLDDAIKLKAKGHPVDLEVYYLNGKKLTNPGTTTRGVKNVDVVTDTMRREWKRVNKPITDKKTLLKQIKDARIKFRDAGLSRSTGGKENIGMVDFGDQLTKGGMSQKWAFREIKKFLQTDNIAKKHMDQLIVRIDGVEHVFNVP